MGLSQRCGMFSYTFLRKFSTEITSGLGEDGYEDVVNKKINKKKIRKKHKKNSSQAIVRDLLRRIF